MISVDTAKSIIEQQVQALPPIPVPLAKATGLTLAMDVISSDNYPPFRQSGMDGYAFVFDDWKNGALTIAGEIQAGATGTPQFQANTAVRIFTGAPVPDALDTVVMQEKTAIENGLLIITDETLKRGGNVRDQGSDIAKGEVALPAGTYLSPAAVGFAAGLGLTELFVHPMPVVALLITGKELQQQGLPLQFGQVYESNSVSITAALQQCGVQSITKLVVDDDLQVLTNALRQAIDTADLVLLTGGVSVGDYDFVSRALHQLGVEIIFHQLKQRPGKPLLFAKKGDTVIFGLPGNPSSVLTCLYEYVLVALQQMIKRPNPFVQNVQVPITIDYAKNTNLTHFLKGWYNNGEVTPLGAQESYRMRSFGVANCLIVLPEDMKQIQKGDLVEVHLLF